MKTVAIVFSAMLLFLASAWPAHAGKGNSVLAGNPANTAHVQKAFDRWVDAYSTGDLPKVMGIFDREVIFSFQGGTDQHYADLASSYACDFKTRKPGTVWVPQIEEIYANGSLAFVRSIWELRMTDTAGATTVKTRNRSIDVLRKNSAGQWHIFRSLNYPEKD